MALIILFGILLLTFLLSLYLVFHKKKSKLVGVMIWSFILLLLVLTFGCSIGTKCHSDSKELLSTFEELNVYKASVDNSKNEQLRYYYFNQVEEYNENYLTAAEKNKNVIFDVFYPDKILNQLSTIDFNLRGE